MKGLRSSNMASKHYCPRCESFNLKRLHRGYFKKVILKQPVQYICRECQEQTSEVAIAANETRQVPVFISAK